MFSVKSINLDTNHDLYIILRDQDAKKLGLKSGDRVKVFHSNNKNKFLICELEVLSCSKKLCSMTLKKEEAGLVTNAYHKLNLKNTDNICVIPSEKPTSLKYVREKFLGEIKLKEEHFDEIIKDITSNLYSDVETTFFVLACMANHLDDNETIALTKSMVNVGKHLNFKSKDNEIVVDKHCIGGIPGNRTTMVVIPIIAAAGLKIPKTSSRSITSPSGTADTMEVLANVSMNLDKMYSVVNKAGGCIAWGGGLELSPADDIIINVEHPLQIDSEGQMIASILSKKVSAGSTHVLLDIPVGKTAKVKDKVDGTRLKKRFEKVGKALGLNMKVIITDGSQPIGRGIGPSLEAKDVLKVLENDKDLPPRLKKKAIFMAGEILEMGKVTRKGLGAALAKNILETGEALTKFNEIIDLQGRSKGIKDAKYSKEIVSELSGSVKEIDNKTISRLAFLLGAPKDKEAGIYLEKKVGERVKKGEVIFKLHSNSKLKLRYGESLVLERNPFMIR